MNKKCTCGFIIADDNGWLLCHPTNAGYNRWDFPKGMAEEDEDHLVAAIRELKEETGIILMSLLELVDLGQHPYHDIKDLHLYYIRVPKIDAAGMYCESMVFNPKGPNFPEMDEFNVFAHHKIKSKLTDRMYEWIKAHLPTEYHEGI